MSTKSAMDLVIEQAERDRDRAQQALVDQLEFVQRQLARDLTAIREGREPGLGWISSVVVAQVNVGIMRACAEQAQDAREIQRAADAAGFPKVDDDVELAHTDAPGVWTAHKVAQVGTQGGLPTFWVVGNRGRGFQADERGRTWRLAPKAVG